MMPVAGRSFAELFESPIQSPVVAFFADKRNKNCQIKEAVLSACKDLRIEMKEFDFRLEVEALQLLEIRRVPAVVLVKGGLGRVISANSDPFAEIRLQLIAAGVKLP
jgi:hypothetical protein